MTKRLFIPFALLLFICFAFYTTTQDSQLSKYAIPSSEQRKGDVENGKQYLLTGDYVNSGIPADIFLMQYEGDTSNYLNREGLNAKLPYSYTVVNAPNGIPVIAPNCLQCHGGMVAGQFILGVGNSTRDFTRDYSSYTPMVRKSIELLFGNNSPQMEAALPFLNAVSSTGPTIITENRGTNPADMLAAVLASHRDPVTLKWADSARASLPEKLVPADVPPWWVLKKKNAMFYTGSGRGDFAKYLMASTLLTLKDSSEANQMEQSFVDMLAYLRSLEPPKYPGIIDDKKLALGRSVFSDNCAKCHGTYEEKDTFPNLLIPLHIIQTDSLLSASLSSGELEYFKDWLNHGWFGKGENPARFEAEGGYVAQPLDGIWASAPYLHNASVPTLYDLLKSTSRPTFWRRSFRSTDYDHEKVGWIYSEESSADDRDTYDTTIPGYQNHGHTFGDKLTEEERMAVIEYLKSI